MGILLIQNYKILILQKNYHYAKLIVTVRVGHGVDIISFGFGIRNEELRFFVAFWLVKRRIISQCHRIDKGVV